jgi:S1-C subfamily serine protease
VTVRRAASLVALLLAVGAGCAPDPPSAAGGVLAAGCRNRTGTGSGIFVRVEGADQPLFLTSAHVVKGATEITVTRRGATGVGTVVAFDPEMDLAYLRVSGLTSRHPATIDSSDVEEGDDGVAYLARDGQVVALPLTIRRRVQIRTENIYVEGETLRPGFELRADIDPGDSGGAVVVDGKVIGVVWARSNRSPTRAYAIDPVRAGDLVRRQLRTGEIDDTIDLTRC